MPSAWARLRALAILILCFAAAACAGMGASAPGKEKMEAMLNAELMTGDSAPTIEAFFQRHGISYTYDEAIRRYSGTAGMGDRAPLSVYVYVDTDKKMTVTLVQAPKPEPAMQRPRRLPAYYLDVPGSSVPRPPR